MILVCIFFAIIYILLFASFLYNMFLLHRAQCDASKKNTVDIGESEIKPPKAHSTTTP